MLSAEVQADILNRYFTRREKERAIARALGINRKSVARVVRRKSVVLGIESVERRSLLDPYKDKIEAILSGDITIPAQVILQRLRNEGFSGGYTIVRERVRATKERLQGRKFKEAFFTIDFPSGQAAQVDWGEFNDVFGDGVKIHCFVMVLCFSRLLYIEFTRSEKFSEFIRCHENALKYFDAHITEEIWYDNLPTAVTERMGSLVRFNSRFMAYAGHHHFRPHACNKARGNEKGRVEDGVKYIRMNFWPGRSFTDFDDLCRQASEWRDQTANLREHQATKKIPSLVFDHEEKAALKKSNPMPYETDEVFSKEVRPDYHLLYETNRYSVPWTLVGVVITVRISDREIKIYYREKFITRHERCYLKNQKPFTKPEHEKGLIDLKPQGKNAHLTWAVSLIESYGPHCVQYLACLRHNSRSLREETSRLVALATIYGDGSLEQAVGEILKHGAIGVERVELWLKNRAQQNTEALNPEPLTLKSGPLNRIPSRVDLRSYDDMLFKPTQTEDKPDAGNSENQPN